MSTGSEIIQKFEIYVDDSTELSATEELDLLNKIYLDVWSAHTWEFAKKAFSGTINGTSIALPTDFGYIVGNANYTDNSIGSSVDTQAPKLVWVGSDYFKVVNWSDRKQHQNGNYCWVNIVSGTLEFNRSVSGAISYDYFFIPPALTLSTSPLFPSTYHAILYHGMASEDYIIQQFDKAKSYALENQSKFGYWLEKLEMYNANLINN